MEKRVLIAIALSVAVILLYPFILKKLYPAAPAPVEKPVEAGKSLGAGPAEPPAKQAGQAAQAKAATAVARPAVSVKEELTTVETPLFKAVFSSAGAGIKKWEIKKYKETQNPASKPIAIAPAVSTDATFKTLFSLNGDGAELLFQPSKTNISISSGQDAELVYTAAKDGFVIEKRYKFKADSYAADVEVKVSNTTASPATPVLHTTLSASTATPGVDSTNYHTGPILLTKEKLLRQEAKEAQKAGADKIKWLGLENKYFIEAFIPKKELEANWSSEIPSADTARALVQTRLSIKPGESAAFAYGAFLGPKEYDLLLGLKAGVEESIEFGWFSFIAKPFLVVLNFFQRYIKNYGIAIILMTIIVKVIFYPLSTYSMKSMKEMQKIQPQMAALREKYKNDKEKQNKEMMDLYKRHKINPVSGCLPMILQIPVFIGLYEVLYVAIELRHTPFFLWITDLSSKDPYYITPVIMGVTMFIQQKMTPSTVDPTQAKIMLIMPVIFTFMFLNFPSGLVIYWLVNNVLSIAQQYYIQKSSARA